MTAAQLLTIGVLDDYQLVAASLADWDHLAGKVTFFSDHLDDEDALVERLRNFDVVVAMRERTPLPGRVLRRLHRLRLLVTTGMRNPSIDVEAARERGIVVCGTRALSWGVAELTFALLLAVARHVPEEDASMRRGGWQHTIGMTLRDKTLGLLGLGKQGALVAPIAKAFGMRVVAWSPHLTAERAADLGVALVSKNELFRDSDIVSIHLVLGPTTVGVVGEAELRAMGSSAVLVNTSRGALVDEAALLRALHEGWIGGAGLDVYDMEPLPPAHLLRTAPRTVLTPHLGYVTTENYQLLYGDAVEDIEAFLAGQPIRQVVPSPR